jgi:hypothetical protein
MRLRTKPAAYRTNTGKWLNSHGRACIDITRLGGTSPIETKDSRALREFRV